MEKISRRKIILILFLISLVLKLAYGVGHHVRYGSNVRGDDGCYLAVADKITNHGVLAIDEKNGLDSQVGHGLPLIIAGVFLLFGHHLVILYILNAILGGGLTVLIYLIAEKVFNQKTALFAGIWSLVYILYYKWIPFAGKEAWIFFLLPLVIYLALSEGKNQRYTYRFWILIFVYAFFIHLDERFLIYLPLISLIFFVLNFEQKKNAFKKIMIFTLAVIFLMIPWTIRNYKAYGEFVLLTKRTQRIDIVANKFSSVKLKKETEESKHYLTPSQLDSIRGGLATYDRSPIEIERIQRGIIPTKNSIFERWWAEFYEFWTPVRLTPGYSGNGFRFKYRSLNHNLFLFFSFGIILPFFLFGIYQSIRQRNRSGILLTIIIAYHTFFHVFLMWAVYRYRVPIDSFVIILAAFGFYELIRILSEKYYRLNIINIS